MVLDAAQRSLRSRLGGYATAARYDSRAINAKARQTYRDSFRVGHGCALCRLVAIPFDLTEAEIDRRAAALRSTHYTRLAMRSASVRANQRRRPPAV